ncbi:MAG: hypothetical protein M1820_000649 [Bogoriella megaspora]|nr:MAG: hypothetical protein M1820_000649 [Bogoriella megaspora]
MEDYPSPYIAHNVPLVVLSGLGDGSRNKGRERLHPLAHGEGATVQSDLPLIAGERAEQLLEEFTAVGGSTKSWNSRPESGKSDLIQFHLEVAGRKYALPARKAAPPPSSPSMTPQAGQSSSITANRVLHSPLSPLSPGSPLYPDGIMSASWLEKHQYHVPAVFVSFFQLSSDPNRDSLNDNYLKNEINNIKSVFSRSGHRSRYVVVLMCEESVSEASDIEERLAVIRRATGLDPKNSLFFLPPNNSRAELSTFATSTLAALQPVCIEYYRDLTKHARRKKSRSTVPPPTAPPTKGTSQALTAQGWSVRYDVKGGIFAEFRQEMEAAGRNYTMALETLLGSDGIFETTHSWSPRWDEARLLADALATRIIRCFLWNNQTTSATQFWVKYRDSFRNLLDRRSKGTANYGWQVWMGRWAKIMAQTMLKAELPSFSAPTKRETLDAPKLDIIVYAAAEKMFPVGERMPPWNLLAHPGYWFWLSARHAARRRTLAEQIPEEDRITPGQSPATKVASRSQNYDYYLCPESHEEFAFDHGAEMTSVLNLSIAEFSKRGQHRFAARLALDRARELMKANQYSIALDSLSDVWQRMSWRDEGWWRLAYEVISSLYECAVASKDVGLVIATSFELMSSIYPIKRSHQYDLARCVDVLEMRPDKSQEKALVNLQGESVCSFGETSSRPTIDMANCFGVSISFNFASALGNVGEPTVVQIAMTSSAHEASAPVTLSLLAVGFEGSLEQIHLGHNDSADAEDTKESGKSSVQKIDLVQIDRSGPLQSVQGYGNLILHPGATTAFECLLTCKEAGDIRATSARLSIDASAFSINYSVPLSVDETTGDWLIQNDRGIQRRRLPQENPTMIHILPKPPKMQISLPGLLEQYYVGETITLEVEVVNGEEENAEAHAQLHLFDRSGDGSSYDFTSTTPNIESSSTSNEDQLRTAKSFRVGTIAPSEKQILTISLTAPTEPASLSLETKVLYHLESDPSTPISKTFTGLVEVVHPFEASYHTSIYVHPDKWPDFFHVDEANHPNAANLGLARAWLISTETASFATDELLIQDIALKSTGSSAEIPYKITARDGSVGSSGKVLALSQHLDKQFEIVVYTLGPEDRTPVTLDLVLDVIWRRTKGSASLNEKAEADESVTTSMLLSPFVVTNPEPRLICTASPSKSTGQDHSVIPLSYTLENPTMHFLTFSVTMEASEEFAFSGPKNTSFNLVPMSRHEIQYYVMPLESAEDDGEEPRQLRPDLKVVDVYFGQTLKVLAGDGVSSDKQGIYVELGGEGSLPSS